MLIRYYKTSLFVFLLMLNTLCLAENAVIAPLAKKSLLLDVAKQGTLTVAVGARGHILYSTDSNNWHQAMVETRSTLTAVFMLDEQTGWAVGHNAVIVKTTDAARTWQRVHIANNDEAPLLDVYFNTPQQGMAIGAYGLFYKSDDGGNSWQQSDLTINNDEVFQNLLAEPFELHLNAIEAASRGRLYMAAEGGFVLRSDNAGQDWEILSTPYPGSLFGLLPLSYDELLVFGLRGHLYRSLDAGRNWTKIETAAAAMLTNALRINDKHILLSGLAGTLLLSSDSGESFSVLRTEARNGYTAMANQNQGQLILVGAAGIERMALDRLLTPALLQQ